MPVITFSHAGFIAPLLAVSLALAGCAEEPTAPAPSLSSAPLASASVPAPVASTTSTPTASAAPGTRLEQQWAHVRAAGQDRCRERLDATEAHVMPVMNQNEPDARGCGIPRGVMMQRGPSGAVYTPALRLDCSFALALGRVERIVDEEAQRLFGHRLHSFRHRGSYVCRRVVGRERDHSDGLSEHSFGNAVDLSSILLTNGKRIDVVTHYPHPKLPEGELLHRAKKRIAEELGLRVLGPDFDGEHRDHLHIDGGAP